MTATTQLILKDTTFGVPVVAPSALELKKQALAKAKLIIKVETEAEQAVAVEALRDLTSIRKGMEATRKAVKAPVLDLGKRIDDVAHDFMHELDRADNFITGLINHFQRDQLRVQREREQELERERQQAEALEREAQRKREEMELAPTPEAAEAARREAARLERLAEEKRLDEELIGGTELAVAKPKGLTVRAALNFQITDATIFVQAYPQFWTWHSETETLKLKRRELLEELNRPDGRGLFHVSQFPEELPDVKGSRIAKPPGMRIYEEVRSHVR